MWVTAGARPQAPESKGEFPNRCKTLLLQILPLWEHVIANNYKALKARVTYRENTAGGVFQWGWRDNSGIFSQSLGLSPTETSTLPLQTYNWISLSPTSETWALFTLQKIKKSLQQHANLFTNSWSCPPPQVNKKGRQVREISMRIEVETKWKRQEWKQKGGWY